MPSDTTVIPFSERENVREDRFTQVWTEELDDVFADVANYYDNANYVASLGLWGRFRRSFLSMIDLESGQRALDVCAGTNAVGIAMMKKQPGLKVCAIDRSSAMQEVGAKRARQQGFEPVDQIAGGFRPLASTLNVAIDALRSAIPVVRPDAPSKPQANTLRMLDRLHIS